jgi:hypothetical protein
VRPALNAAPAPDIRPTEPPHRPRELGTLNEN